MNQKQADDALGTLSAAYPEITWSVHNKRAAWVVYGQRGDVHRATVEVNRRGGYTAETTMVSAGIWDDDYNLARCGMGDTPVGAMRDAIAEYDGLWDDEAAHRAHLLKLLREEEALLVARLDEARARIAALEVES